MNHFRIWNIKDKEYRVNKWLGLAVILLVIAFTLFVFWEDSFSGKTHGYSRCLPDKVDGCFNSFYNSNVCMVAVNTPDLSVCNNGEIFANCPICSVEHMFAGQELGKPPSVYFNNFWLINGLIVLLGIIFNTLLFNLHIFKGSKKADSDKPIGGVI